MPHVHPRDRDRHPAEPCGATEQRSGRLPSCRDKAACADFLAAMAPMVRKRLATRAPFSPRSRRRVRQHVEAESSSASAPGSGSSCDLPGSVTRDASDRLLPFSRLRTSTRASSVLDLRQDACASSEPRKFLPVSTTVQFASAGRTEFPSNHRRGGRCLPVATRAYRASDIPVASLAPSVTLARSRTS